MIYSFIRGSSSLFPVRAMCRVLGVSPAGYYASIQRQPSVTEKKREELAGEIRTAHTEVKRRYGSPRMHAELKARGHACSVNTVAKIMKELGIQAISHRKFRVSTTDSNHDFPVAANVVDQDFTASKPNEIWLADITYIPTDEGWLYLAAVEDLYSRSVVGWSMDAKMESRLVVPRRISNPENNLNRAPVFRGEVHAGHHDRCCRSTADRSRRNYPTPGGAGTLFPGVARAGTRRGCTGRY